VPGWDFSCSLILSLFPFSSWLLVLHFGFQNKGIPLFLHGVIGDTLGFFFKKALSRGIIFSRCAVRLLEHVMTFGERVSFLGYE